MFDSSHCSWHTVMLRVELHSIPLAQKALQSSVPPPPPQEAASTAKISAPRKHVIVRIASPPVLRGANRTLGGEVKVEHESDKGLCISPAMSHGAPLAMRHFLATTDYTRAEIE